MDTQTFLKVTHIKVKAAGPQWKKIFNYTIPCIRVEYYLLETGSVIGGGLLGAYFRGPMQFAIFYMVRKQTNKKLVNYQTPRQLREKEKKNHVIFYL